ncbi:protein shisa-5-like [Dendronephthya gigantea]|uniref:protein shisa-5-like n=1 Tax=Dendronephthya gigantea TaxID=151771 RepID=UPI001068ED5A|nr:protein shisa-5-like [Dendronephthya gigantea]
MKLFTRYRNLWLVYLCFVYFVTLATACDTDSDCNIVRFPHDEEDKCCHGTCISKESSCISGAAIAGIVIGCLIIGGIVISCCLCFCCACGPFQNRSQGTVIRYGGRATQTTTTGVSSYPTASVQAGYPQPVGVTQYPNATSSDEKYPQPGTYPSAVQGASAAPYPPQPNSAYPPAAPPTYDEASNPPPYNPGYPQ